MVSKKAFAEAMRLLLDNGFRFTIIGGTIIALAVSSDDLGPDVDVFAEHPNVTDEQRYLSAAEANSWDYGQTWLGTPRLTIVAQGEEVPVEFYDNIYDFYVPERFIRDARRVEVEGVRVRMLTPEQYLVLKGRAGRDVDEEALKQIGELVRKGRLKVDADRIREAAKEFEDERIIIRRLAQYRIIS